MRFLIDGHNLIAHLPDIELDDPDDEAKLVYKLRSFCTRSTHRVTVVFDGGIPGGISTSLSNSKVTAVFAAAERMTADAVLKGAMRKIKNTDAYTLVSSDQEVIEYARSRQIAVLRAHEFIQKQLHKVSTPSADKDENLRLSADQVEEWMAIFTKRKD